MKLSAPTKVHVATPTGSSMNVAKICRRKYSLGKSVIGAGSV